MKYLFCAVVLFVAACSSKDDFGKLARLSGLWQTDTGEGILYEEWSKEKNGTMYGKSYMLNGADSMVFERISLTRLDSGMYYIPTVKEQNKELPVPFRMISANDSSFVFENTRHDFPQRIIYRFVNRDSIVARIEGDVKGEQRSMEYSFRRVR